MGVDWERKRRDYARQWVAKRGQQGVPGRHGHSRM